MPIKRNNFLSRILSVDHRAAGLYLQEDDHFVTLFHGEDKLADFTSNATVESILAEADQWMNRQNSGIAFADVRLSANHPLQKVV